MDNITTFFEMSNFLEISSERHYIDLMKSATPSLDRLAHALSDPIRLQILDLLSEVQERDKRCSPANPDAPGAVCACDLRPGLGKIAPSKLAYHLRLLREAGLLHEQPRGRWVYYTLNREALAGFAGQVLERFGPRRGD
jgi:ArsR family transcriptional regulator